jgi:hypothetical protein
MFLFLIKNNPNTNPKEIKTMKRNSLTQSFHYLMLIIAFLFVSLIAQSQIKILTDGLNPGRSC